MPEGDLIVGDKYKVFTLDKYDVISFFLTLFISGLLTKTTRVVCVRFNIIYLVYHVTAHTGFRPLHVLQCSVMYRDIGQVLN